MSDTITILFERYSDAEIAIRQLYSLAISIDDLILSADGKMTARLVQMLIRNGDREKNAYVFAEGVRRGGTVVSACVPEHLVTYAVEMVDQLGGRRAGPLDRQYSEEGWFPRYEDSGGDRLDDDGRRSATQLM